MTDDEFEAIQTSNKNRIVALQQQGVSFDQRIAQDMTFQQIIEDLYPANSDLRRDFTARVEVRVAEWLNHIEEQSKGALEEARLNQARQTLLQGGMKSIFRNDN